jgi:hypothetical protein
MTVRRRLAITAATAGTISIIAAISVVALGATGDGSESSLVPISPCRLVDTRPAPLTVGTRSTPIGAGQTVSFQVTGSNGSCVIPSNATAIASNVTIVNPSAASYLTVFPSDSARPNASNLNWTPGAAPTPNQVTVALGSTGAIKVFNLAGSVDVIIDVVGYYLPSAGGPTGPTGPTGPAPTTRTITWPTGYTGPSTTAETEYVGTYAYGLTTAGCSGFTPIRGRIIVIDGPDPGLEFGCVSLYALQTSALVSSTAWNGARAVTVSPLDAGYYLSPSGPPTPVSYYSPVVAVVSCGFGLGSNPDPTRTSWVVGTVICRTTSGGVLDLSEFSGPIENVRSQPWRLERTAGVSLP